MRPTQVITLTKHELEGLIDFCESHVLGPFPLRVGRKILLEIWGVTLLPGMLDLTKSHYISGWSTLEIVPDTYRCTLSPIASPEWIHLLDSEGNPVKFFKEAVGNPAEYLVELDCITTWPKGWLDLKITSRIPPILTFF